MTKPYSPKPVEDAECDQPCSLLLETLKLIRKLGVPSEQLARDLNVPMRWLYSVQSGEVSSPGVNRVQYMYEKLSGKKLLP
jgi:hypothetical protein